MASDEKKTKPEPAPKKEIPAENTRKEAAAENKGTPDADLPKAEGGETAAPSGYSRGEGQKPVSKAYKDNWNTIFAKKKKR